MTNRDDLPNLHNTDPRKAGGDIVGPGGPRTRHGVLLSAENAVILSSNEVTVIEVGRHGEPNEVAVALLMEGRINKTPDISRVLYITNGDGAAALVTQLLGLAMRAEKEGDARLADEFTRCFGERWKDMPK